MFAVALGQLQIRATTEEEVGKAMNRFRASVLQHAISRKELAKKLEENVADSPFPGMASENVPLRRR